MTGQLEQRLLTVDEYHRMTAAGILNADDRVELLNGQLIKMSPIGSQHAACVEKIDELLKALLKGKAMVRAQNPVVMDDFSEPEPDLAVVRHRDNYYADRHPNPADVYILIEVADSSPEKDRQAKLPIYAAAGIPEYWIVNLEKRELEVYRAPAKNTYRHKQLWFPGDRLEMEVFGVSLAIDDLLV